MKIIFSIIINAIILYAIAYFLWANEIKNIESGVILWCNPCSLLSIWALKTYLIWGIILWTINVTIKPILKIVAIPLFFIFFWLVVFVINWVILWLFDYIINKLLISWVWYHIEWTVNFIIAVAIFTVLNMLYSLLFFKK